jgi:hypothetical protein
MKRSAVLGLIIIIAFASIAVFLSSCSQSPTDPVQQPVTLQKLTMDRRVTIPAYYDSTLFQIMLRAMPAQADSAVLKHNHNINTIYMTEPGDTSSIDVLDAIQGDGFNPLWREVDIVFNTGFTPHQFFSDNQVLAAAGGVNPEINLVFTNEIYVCAVVGPKH